MNRSPHKCIFAKIISYVILIFWAITTIYPILWVVQNSFKNKDKILAHSFSLPLGQDFTLDNYRTAFETLDIFKAYGNSFFISSIVSILVVVLGGMAAYALVRYCGRSEKIINYFIIAGMMAPVFSTIIPVFSLERSMGIASTDNWLFSMISIILPQTAGNLAFAIVVFSVFIREISLEQEEAAYIEGSSMFQTFFYVMVPMLKPAIATVAIFVFVWSYNDLFTQMFFLRRRETFTITRLISDVGYNEGANYGLLTASVTLVLIPVVLVYILLQRYIISGMTTGAVKG